MAVVLPLILAAGCAVERPVWVNPDVSQDRWALDRAACRQQAEERAAAQLDRDRASGTLSSSGGSLSQQFAVEEARDYRRRLYRHCLSARGYIQRER